MDTHRAHICSKTIQGIKLIKKIGKKISVTPLRVLKRIKRYTCLDKNGKVAANALRIDVDWLVLRNGKENEVDRDRI